MKKAPHLEDPKTTPSKNAPDVLTPIAQTKSIHPNQQTENMEVHHHPHHEGKKTWKDYFWEFSMLFLAVFCGFMAEWQLEHVIEHSKEKEFIVSMIEDAQIDTANINTVLKANNRQSHSIDSLVAVCFNYENQKTNDYAMYKLYRKALTVSNFAKPTERTLLQLKNAGGMRLIRNKTAADAIISYDGVEKDVQDQRENVEKLAYDYIAASYSLFSFKYFNPPTYIGVSPEAKLLSRDPLKLTQFGNRLSAYGGTFANYNYKLAQMKKSSVTLINTLRKEYHLTEE